MRHPRRFGLQGRIHDSGDLSDLVRRLSTASGSDVPQTVQPLIAEALSPQNHRVSIHRKPFRNGDIGLACSGGQNDSATQSDLLWGAVGCSPLLELLLFDFRKLTRIPHDPR